MGRGGQATVKCGTKNIWIALTVISVVAFIVLLAVGIVLLTKCSSAEDDCDANLKCKLLRNVVGDGCVDENMDNCATKMKAAWSCASCPSCSLFDSESECNNVASLLCDWGVACQCSKTRAGLALIIVGILFAVAGGVFVCGVVPCCCFKGPEEDLEGAPPGVVMMAPVGVDPPIMGDQPPPGAVFQKNGVWVDKEGNSVTDGTPVETRLQA